MMRKLVFWLALLPLAIIILMFAAANRERVMVSFDPFSATQPAASVSVPLFVLIFTFVIVGVILGGIAAWLRQSAYRRAARASSAEIVALRREIESLNSRLADAMEPSLPDPAARISYRPRAG